MMRFEGNATSDPRRLTGRCLAARALVGMTRTFAGIGLLILGLSGCAPSAGGDGQGGGFGGMNAGIGGSFTSAGGTTAGATGGEKGPIAMSR